MNPNFYCPISRQIFRHPVIASDSHTYEAESLLAHIKANSNTSPTTREPLTSVTYNRALNSMIDEACANSEERYDDYDRDDTITSLNLHIASQRLSIVAKPNRETALVSALIVFISSVTLMSVPVSQYGYFGSERATPLSVPLFIAFIATVLAGIEYYATLLPNSCYQGYKKTFQEPIIEAVGEELVKAVSQPGLFRHG